MKNTPTQVCAKTADLQDKVGTLVLSTTSCPSVIALETALN
jgi:hypothetical protein